METLKQKKAIQEKHEHQEHCENKNDKNDNIVKEPKKLNLSYNSVSFYYIKYLLREMTL